MASLYVLQGPDQGKRFFLTRTSARIGREKSNLVNLSDQEVSRCHAELILAESGAYKILDLGSANGTFLNGQPVTNASLKPGDVIQVGSSILGYEPGQDLTTRVELLSAADPMNRSAIVSSVSARPAGSARNPDKAAKNRASAAARRLRLTAMAVRNTWMRMFCKPRRIARASPCQHFASPWNPSDRQRWR